MIKTFIPDKLTILTIVIATYIVNPLGFSDSPRIVKTSISIDYSIELEDYQDYDNVFQMGQLDVSKPNQLLKQLRIFCKS